MVTYTMTHLSVILPIRSLSEVETIKNVRIGQAPHVEGLWFFNTISYCKCDFEFAQSEMAAVPCFVS